MQEVEGPVTIANNGAHSSLWRFHFCRKLFQTEQGSVFIGSYEAAALFELDREFFRTIIDCEAIYYVEKRKYNISNLLRFRVEVLHQFVESLMQKLSESAHPILLFCSDATLFSPIFGIALMIRNGLWKNSLSELIQYTRSLCSDMYSSYDPPVIPNIMEQEIQHSDIQQYLSSKIFLAKKEVLLLRDKETAEWIEVLTIYSALVMEMNRRPVVSSLQDFSHLTPHWDSNSMTEAEDAFFSENEEEDPENTTVTVTSVSSFFSDISYSPNSNSKPNFLRPGESDTVILTSFYDRIKAYLTITSPQSNLRVETRPNIQSFIVSSDPSRDYFTHALRKAGVSHGNNDDPLLRTAIPAGDMSLLAQASTPALSNTTYHQDTGHVPVHPTYTEAPNPDSIENDDDDDDDWFDNIAGG